MQIILIDSQSTHRYSLECGAAFEEYCHHTLHDWHITEAKACISQIGGYLSVLVCLRVVDLITAQTAIEQTIPRAGPGGPEAIQSTFNAVLLTLRAHILALEAGTVRPYKELLDMNDLDTDYIRGKLLGQVKWLALGFCSEEDARQQQVHARSSPLHSIWRLKVCILQHSVLHCMYINPCMLMATPEDRSLS